MVRSAGFSGESLVWCRKCSGYAVGQKSKRRKSTGRNTFRIVLKQEKEEVFNRNA